MNREETMKALGRLAPELGRLGVRSLSIFGSVARDEAQASSDLDLVKAQ